MLQNIQGFCSEIGLSIYWAEAIVAVLSIALGYAVYDFLRPVRSRRKRDYGYDNNYGESYSKGKTNRQRQQANTAFEKVANSSKIELELRQARAKITELETQIRQVRKERDTSQERYRELQSGITESAKSQSHAQESTAPRQPSAVSQAARGPGAGVSAPVASLQISPFPAHHSEETLNDWLPDQFPSSAAAPATRLLYADIPEADGSFKTADLKREPAWDSLFTLEISNKEFATLTLQFNPDRFTAAIQAPQKYLSPVCSFASNPASGSRTIRGRNSGRMRLIDGRWKIEQKLEIEFS